MRILVSGFKIDKCEVYPNPLLKEKIFDLNEKTCFHKLCTKLFVAITMV